MYITGSKYVLETKVVYFKATNEQNLSNKLLISLDTE